jgi:hypothetical protein
VPWVVIDNSNTPFSPNPAQRALQVNITSGAIEIDLPTPGIDTQMILICDALALSQSFPIKIVPPAGGVSVQVPGSTATFSVNPVFLQQNGASVGYQYKASTKQWVQWVYLVTPPPVGLWQAVTAGMSPFTPVQASSTFLAVNTSSTQVTINTPASPMDGDILAVTDATGNAGGNAIRVGPTGSGVSIDDPSAPGTYRPVGQFATIAVNGGNVWWKFNAATNQWIKTV